MDLHIKIAGKGVRYLRRLKAKGAAKVITKVELSNYMNGGMDSHDLLFSFRIRQKPLFFLDEINHDSLKEILPHREEIIKDTNEI